MFVIVTYDIVEARSLNRIRKILRKYVQNCLPMA
ncbi:hypothetical protein ACTPEF_25545 [Clostridioides difficile]